SIALCEGVEALDRRLEPLALDMGVNLSGRNIGMAEHLLDSPQIGAAGEQVAGKGVAQHMRRDPPVIESRLACERLELDGKMLARQMRARAMGREEPGRTLRAPISDAREIASNHCPGPPGYRHHALAPTLALDHYELIGRTHRARF